MCISYSSAAVAKAAGGKMVHFGSQFQRDKDKPTGREGTVAGAGSEARL